MGKLSQPDTVIDSAAIRPALEEACAATSGTCTECMACVGECAFLQTYGTPKKIAEVYDPAIKGQQVMPFECSLCGLCTAVCPEGVDPQAMFLEMRRESVARGVGSFPEHGGLLGYERKGTSRRFSWYGLPAGCDTVFFPGCALPGTRPDATVKLYDHLRRAIPSLGIVLDCCTKPSHDLGRDDYFRAMFGELREYLAGQGVKTILVACPNCHRVFSEYAPELTTRTIYEELAGLQLPSTGTASGSVTVHDPCVMRFAAPVQAAARSLAQGAGVTIEEMPHTQRMALCCGEGGTVGALAPEFAGNWRERRKREAAGRRIITYCAGCAHHLKSVAPTSHIVDLMLEPEAAMAGKVKVSGAPFTYLNRLRLKNHFRKTVPAAVSRERTFTSGETAKGGGLLRSLLIIALLVGAIVAVRVTGATRYLEQETLRSAIQGYGVLAPAVYMLVYTLAPALFLPGLPITIVGGILFGPFWGVIYTITSATMGACLAFLISRYAARGWVERKLVGSRWQKLDREVERHGWKVVAFTRLIPLFPFNLLNYALGLTKVKFLHYAVATFVFMLPACIAFIVFSSSLLDLMRGKVSPAFLLGLALVVLVSLFPLFYRRWQARKDGAAYPDEAARYGGAAVYDPKARVLRKVIVSCCVAAVAVGAYLLVQHYFWFLNAYLYTAEFNFLFVLGRLRDGNVAMFADYLKPMGLGRGVTMVTVAHFLQGFWLPLSPQVVVTAGGVAFGMVKGFIYNSGALSVVGCIAFGLGRFLLGDLIPLIRMQRGSSPAEADRYAGITAVPLLVAIPWIPVTIVPLLAGALRIPFVPGAFALIAGVTIRVLCILLFL